MLIERLSFGRAMPAGGYVTDDDWRAFEAHAVASYFPEGYTVMKADGGWRDVATGQTIREPSIILEVAHNGDKEAAVRAVARSYKDRFAQDAVMRSTVNAAVSFI